MGFRNDRAPTAEHLAVAPSTGEQLHQRPLDERIASDRIRFLRKSRLAATLALLVVPLGSISGSVDPSGGALLVSWESAVAHTLEDDRPGPDFLSGPEPWAHHAALPAAPYTLELTGRSNGGPLIQFGAQPRQGTPAPTGLPASSAIDIRLALLSHLDHAAQSAAARSGALSSRSTSIPPPLHA